MKKIRNFVTLLFFLSLLISGNRVNVAAERGKPDVHPVSDLRPVSVESKTNTLPDAIATDVYVNSVWTTDGDGNRKSTFRPGDGIRYYAEIHTNGGNIVNAYFRWSADGPCGSIASWSGNLETGSWTWWLPTRIPDNACGGTYTYRVSVTYNGETSSQDTSFSVITEDRCDTSSLREFLQQKHSPLADHVGTLISVGSLSDVDVDPRFVIAISNAESTYGTNGACATQHHNAWGYGGGWPRCWNFSNWDEAIRTVTEDIGKEYFNHYHQTTIESFVVQPYGTCTSHCWCVSGCRDWVSNVRSALEAQGGDPTNLRYSACANGGGTTCPGRYHAQYFSNRSLGGSPVYSTCEDQPIDHDWGGGSPGHGVPSDNFSARWVGRFHFDGGPYRFTAEADDGIRVWIDGQGLIDRWVDQSPTSYRSTKSLGAGDHEVKVEYYEHGGGAVARFRWEKGSDGPSGYTFCSNEHERCSFSGTKDVAYGANGRFTYRQRVTGGIDCNNGTFGDPAPGVFKACYIRNSSSMDCPGRYKAEYFNNRSLSGSPVYVTCEGWPIDHDWGGGSPGHGVHSDNFSARWTGRAHIDSGTYDFIARADDGIRVWVGGSLIINGWRDQAPTEYRVTRSVGSGDYDIKVEYYEHGGGAVAQFRWERHSGGSGRVYEIAAKHSGKCLDVEGARQDDGTNVQQWAYGGGPNQLWYLVDAGGGYYKIVARHSGKCLDVCCGSRDNGANVLQWTCHGGDNQLWRLVRFGNYYEVVSKNSGKCLDVEGARQDNGANVQQWACGGGPNQLWRFIER